MSAVHPPGTYPVVVVGSGPGGLQASYSLARLGIRHAVLSADAAPGGTFLRWPHFQRLITWTKPHTGVPRTSRWYERYDWNSLIGDEDAHRATVADQMEGSSYFPTRDEMQRGVEAFVGRTGLAVEFECRWTATRREDSDYVLETSRGEYRTRLVVVATGMTRPYRPPIPGLEDVPHYREVKPLDAYRDRRVLIIGKRNSGFELADGLLPHARQIVLASPRSPQFALETHTIAGVRARYVQPLEDQVLNGGVFVLDASVDRIERRDGRYVVRLRPSLGGEDLALEFDEIINATGFMSDLADLPALGLATHGHLEVPAQTPLWESSTLPGVFFAGTLTQGARGLRKHGVPSASASVHGARYNARILARHLAETRLGMTVPRRQLRPAELVPYLLAEMTRAPELWLQRSYLARIVTVGRHGIVDEGILPLESFVDASGEDAIAVTIELGKTGDNYPVVYVRRGGGLSEHIMSGSTLQDFETVAHARELAAILRPLDLAIEPETPASAGSEQPTR